jgi:hypothetical protein
MIKPKSVALCLILAVLVGCARNNSQEELIRNPSALNGKHVDAQGVVKILTISTTGKPYMVFDLCSPACVTVFTHGHPNIKDGDKLTVHGVVRPWVGSPGAYQIVADEGSL